MKITDVYGIAAGSPPISGLDNAPNVARAAEIVRDALGIELQSWTSDAWNGTYYRYSGKDYGNVLIVNNAVDDDFDDMPFLQYPEYGVVIEVHAAGRPDDVRVTLTAAGFVHIQRSTLG